MRLEVFKGRGPHPWYVRLIARNGQTFLISEGYVLRSGAVRAAKRMVAVMAQAKVGVVD
jgi:uncharacterized protein YegP (UPF0339 family)